MTLTHLRSYIALIASVSDLPYTANLYSILILVAGGDFLIQLFASLNTRFMPVNPSLKNY
jgi:hypothetical protein